MSLQDDVRLTLGKMDDVVIWRNHVAAFEVDGRFQRSGLVKGSADLIGIVTRQVKLLALAKVCGEYVRFENVGIFLALEIKEGKGRLSLEQRMFLDLVNRMGGVGREIRSIEEAIEAVEVARGKAFGLGGNREATSREATRTRPGLAKARFSKAARTRR